MNFRKMIEGASVVFVGPSPIISGKRYGKWIDSFDFVVRSNGGFDIQERFKEDYGSRTDLLYVNVQYAREMRPLPIAHYVKSGIKALMMKSPSGQDVNMYSQKIYLRNLRALSKQMGSEVQGLLYGPIIIRDLANHNPSDLWMTGVDFYQSKPRVFIPGDYREYLPGYLPEKITQKADVDNIGRVDPHNYRSNAKYFKSMIDSGELKVTKEAFKIIKEIT